MRDEYDISSLNPKKNPYTNRLKQQITISVDGETINFLKKMSDKTGLSYQALISLYLSDCAKNNRQVNIS